MAVPKRVGWAGGESKGFGSGRVGVLIFRKLTCSRLVLGVRERLAWRGKGSGGGPRASVPGGG